MGVAESMHLGREALDGLGGGGGERADHGLRCGGLAHLLELPCFPQVLG